MQMINIYANIEVDKYYLKNKYHHLGVYMIKLHNLDNCICSFNNVQNELRISDDNGRNFKTILKCYGNYRLLGWEYNTNKLHLDIRKGVR